MLTLEDFIFLYANLAFKITFVLLLITLVITKITRKVVYKWVKVALIANILVFIIYAVIPSNLFATGNLKISKNEKRCSIDTDCKVIPEPCGCGSIPINKDYYEKYSGIEYECDYAPICPHGGSNKSLKCIDNYCKWTKTPEEN